MIEQPFKSLRFRRSVVLLSGGQDSTTCLALASRCSDEVVTATVDYGQRHRGELSAAQHVASALGVALESAHLLHVPALGQLGDSVLLDTTRKVVPEQHHSRDGELPATFVPGRNSILVSVAAAVAYRVGAEAVWLGVNQTDYSGYPDCRKGWVEAKEEELQQGVGDRTNRQLGIHSRAPDDMWPQLVAPLLHMTKAQTFALAAAAGVLEVVAEQTVTCYNGEVGQRLNPAGAGRGCGVCASCNLRANGYRDFESFREALVEDAELWLNGKPRRHAPR